jgi:hypothetical protein
MQGILPFADADGAVSEESFTNYNKVGSAVESCFSTIFNNSETKSKITAENKKIKEN